MTRRREAASLVLHGFTNIGKKSLSLRMSILDYTRFRTRNKQEVSHDARRHIGSIVDHSKTDTLRKDSRGNNSKIGVLVPNSERKIGELVL